MTVSPVHRISSVRYSVEKTGLGETGEITCPRSRATVENAGGSVRQSSVIVVIVSLQVRSSRQPSSSAVVIVGLPISTLVNVPTVHARY
jgi:hypothetical protein